MVRPTQTGEPTAGLHSGGGTGSGQAATSGSFSDLELSENREYVSTGESFNGRLRDECCGLEWFRARLEGGICIAQ